MINYKVPNWVKEANFSFNSYKAIPSRVFDEVNLKLDRLQNGNPLVSVIIAAYNEEINILRCINSLSNTTYKQPVEFIVVNNSSSDHTQATIDRLNVRKFFQPIQGCGPARQLGQENARGKYILLADADCLYPAAWMEEMMKVLQRPGVACVYGRYSFIPEAGYSRSQLYMLEKMKDVITAFRHIKRPYLNAFGISMGYVKEYGLKAGYVMHNIRGEDGRLAFDMMKYGRSFYKALTKRVIIEFKRFFSLMKSEKPHDTKSSGN
jgi:glycosyltransferase involved in cell wall biosynthesis